MNVLMITTAVLGLINSVIVLLVGANFDPFPRLLLCSTAVFGAFSSAALFGVALKLSGAIQ